MKTNNFINNFDGNDKLNFKIQELTTSDTITVINIWTEVIVMFTLAINNTNNNDAIKLFIDDVYG